MRKSILAVLLVVGTLAARAFAQQDGYRVVVNAANPTTNLSRAEVARLFLKKVPKWPDGQAVQPADQERVSPVRQAFSLAIHQKDVDAVASYWQVLVFSGREVPPRTVKSDAEMLQFVRDNPGAVGYVSESAPLAGVKAIAVRP